MFTNSWCAVTLTRCARCGEERLKPAKLFHLRAMTRKRNIPQAVITGPSKFKNDSKKNISDLCNFDEHLHHLGTKSIQVALHSRIHAFTAFSSPYSTNHEPNLPRHILLTCSLKAIYRSITFRSIHSEYLSKQGLCSDIVWRFRKIVVSLLLPGITIIWSMGPVHQLISSSFTVSDSLFQLSARFCLPPFPHLCHASSCKSESPWYVPVGSMPCSSAMTCDNCDHCGTRLLGNHEIMRSLHHHFKSMQWLQMTRTLDTHHVHYRSLGLVMQETRLGSWITHAESMQWAWNKVAMLYKEFLAYRDICCISTLYSHKSNNHAKNTIFIKTYMCVCAQSTYTDNTYITDRIYRMKCVAM